MVKCLTSLLDEIIVLWSQLLLILFNRMEVFYMREILREWQRDWIKENGETHDLEVVIKDGKLDDLASCIYEGSFVDIPDELLDKKVIDYWRIVESSIPERNGAYSLTIRGKGMEEKNIEKLYELLERAEKEKDSETMAVLRWAIFNLENK